MAIVFRAKLLGSKRYFAFSLICLALFIPELAMAAGGSGHGPKPGIASLFWPAVNFCIYLALLSFAYRKVGKPALMSRAVEIKNHLERATSALADAERELGNVQQRKALLEEEKQQILESLRAEGEAVSSSMIEAAHRQVLKIGSDAERRVDGDTSKVQAQLRAEVVALASKLARDSFQSGLSEAQDRELRRSAIKEVLN